MEGREEDAIGRRGMKVGRGSEGLEGEDEARKRMVGGGG